MWATAARFANALSDLTVGTVIVLVHAVLADRQNAHAHRPSTVTLDGTRIWRSQISP